MLARMWRAGTAPATKPPSTFRRGTRNSSPAVARREAAGSAQSVQERPSTGAAQAEAQAVAEGGHALARAHDDRPVHFRMSRRAPMPGHGSGRHVLATAARQLHDLLVAQVRQLRDVSSPVFGVLPIMVV